MPSIRKVLLSQDSATLGARYPHGISNAISRIPLQLVGKYPAFSQMGSTGVHPSYNSSEEPSSENDSYLAWPLAGQANNGCVCQRQIFRYLKLSEINSSFSCLKLFISPEFYLRQNFQVRGSPPSSHFFEKVDIYGDACPHSFNREEIQPKFGNFFFS